MKTKIAFVSMFLAIWSFGQLAHAQAAPSGSAQAVQLNVSAAQNTPLLYIIYVGPDGTQYPQAPYQVFIGDLFAAMQTVSQKGVNPPVYSFGLTDKRGNSLVTSFRIDWVKDGVVRDQRHPSGWHENGLNWFFATTNNFGKNTGALKTGFVNDILGSSAGGTQARFPGQQFTVDGPGTYEVRLWATVDGLQVFKQLVLNIPVWYEPL